MNSGFLTDNIPRFQKIKKKKKTDIEKVTTTTTTKYTLKKVKNMCLITEQDEAGQMIRDSIGQKGCFLPQTGRESELETKGNATEHKRLDGHDSYLG